jgi:KDO2-lipid IV(A) lauroyltransferase
MSIPLRRRLRSTVAGFLVGLMERLLRRRSWSSVQSWGRRLGDLAWHVSRRDRRRCRTHLALAFPDLSEAERSRIAHACFRHLATNVTELLYLHGRPGRDVLGHVDIEGREGIEALRRAGTPLLVLTGHCGNWELLGPVFEALGIPLSAVVRAPDEPEFHRLLEDLRRSFGTATIDRGSPGAARQLLTALREGRALVMLIDQDTRVEAVRVPFFGRPASTPVGAAKLALKRDAAVVPAFMERRDDGRHLARFLPPLELPPDPTEATAVMTAAIEQQIRRRPEQWVWMHRRWRRGTPPNP